LGLGLTPQDVGTPGLKCYTPTRLQMEVLARKKVEREVVALQQIYCQSKPTGEQQQATRGAGRLPGLLVGLGPSVNGPRSGTRPGFWVARRAT
jgi:hypothetical protein